MITYSGVHIQKIGGVEGTPTPLDIAVHSGRICRYGGAIWYPLLPHLVLVGLLAYRRSGLIANLLWGFLHDAHEAITSDVPRPFKCDCMRKEQSAIDLRLLAEWFSPEFQLSIDFDLIKQCDTDALHIEAVELGLPGFAEIELKYASDYCDEKTIYSKTEDVEMFHRLLKSPLFLDTIQGTESRGVRMFASVLVQARVNALIALEMVEDWKLL